MCICVNPRYRRYHRFIPNLRGRDGLNAARGLAEEGL